MKPRVRGMKADGVGNQFHANTNKRGHQHVKTRVRRAIKRGIKQDAAREVRYEIVDRHGVVDGGWSRDDAVKYATLWDRDCPDDAPHTVRKGEGAMKIEIVVPWACPRCGAKANEHGKGGAERCEARGANCDGFICECDFGFDTNIPEHGERYDLPCHEAHCTHCGWGGTFPVKPKGLQTWERKALDAGWVPPEKRREELGMCAGRKAT